MKSTVVVRRPVAATNNSARQLIRSTRAGSVFRKAAM
jgi:hypothetical protein